jgi:hypothetical protein
MGYIWECMGYNWVGYNRVWDTTEYGPQMGMGCNWVWDTRRNIIKNDDL